MDSTSHPTASHPVLACAAEISHALKAVVDVDPIFMATTDKAEALVELTRLSGQLEALRLRVIAVAGDVAEQDGSRHVGTWLGPRTRTDTSVNTAAGYLHHRWTRVAAGLADGTVQPGRRQAAVQLAPPPRPRRHLRHHTPAQRQSASPDDGENHARRRVRRRPAGRSATRAVARLLEARLAAVPERRPRRDQA